LTFKLVSVRFRGPRSAAVSPGRDGPRSRVREFAGEFGVTSRGFVFETSSCD
jgi:hypothetical protein